MSPHFFPLTPDMLPLGRDGGGAGDKVAFEGRVHKPTWRCGNASYDPSQMLHVWNIYLHLPQKWPSFVGKYTIHGAHGFYGI